MIVVWRVTTQCNLGCGFCAYARDLDVPRRVADPAAILRFARTLSRYKQETGKRVLVSWLGGEPLSWQPLRGLTTTLAEDLALEISATTNGTTLADTSQREHIRRCYAELTVSVDGLAPFHDAVRGWRGGFQRLGRDVRALIRESRAARDGLRVRINTVLMRDNLDEFPQLCREVADWGVDEITFNQLGGNDRPEFFRQHRLEAGHLRELGDAMPELRAALALRGVRLSGTPAYLQRLTASACGERVNVPDCQPGEEFLFVDERGLAAPCSFTTGDYGVPIESIDSVAALLALPAAFRAARRTAPSVWCSNCPSTQWFGKFAA